MALTQKQKDYLAFIKRMGGLPYLRRMGARDSLIADARRMMRQQKKRKTKTKPKKTKRKKVSKKLNFKRPSPAISATSVPVGTVKRGNNKKLFIVRRLSNGVQRWVPYH